MPDTYTVTCTFTLSQPIDPWARVAVTPCQACGGKLQWAEAGYVPGYRICEDCGTPWIAQPAGGGAGRFTVTLTRPPT